MSCVLRVSGACFDVDEFLKTSTLDVLTAFHRGGTQFPASSITRKNEFSGMSVSVSTREFSDLSGQIEDAIRFLSENERELMRLRDFPGIDRLELDFPIEEREVVYQRDAFPHLLLSMLGNLHIGLAVSRYPAAPVAESRDRTH